MMEGGVLDCFKFKDPISQVFGFLRAKLISKRDMQLGWELYMFYSVPGCTAFLKCLGDLVSVYLTHCVTNLS